MHVRIRHVSTIVLLLASSACDYIDRARNGGETAVDTSGVTATAGGFLLAMQMPGAIGEGGEGTVRLSLTNRGDTVPRGVTLDLLMPLWVEPLPPRPGERPVTMTAVAEEGLRFTFTLDDEALGPGQTQTVEQRIRIPDDAPRIGGGGPRGQIVRARLIDPNGQPLVEVASQLALDGEPTDSIGGPGEAAVEPDRIGAVRLGMTRAAVAASAAGTRDTSWTQEGMQERGLVVPYARSGRAVAVLSGDTVTRIEVRDSTIRVHERVGVGSTLQQLRGVYGRPCAAVGEGEIVVWFSSAPGISFALDAPLPEQPGQIAANPERIPSSARVTRWWVRRGTDGCP